MQRLRAICVLHCEIRKQGASMSKSKNAKASIAKIASYLCVALRDKKARREYEQVQECKSQYCKDCVCVLHCKIASAIKSDERFEKKRRRKGVRGGGNCRAKIRSKRVYGNPPRVDRKRLERQDNFTRYTDLDILEHNLITHLIFSNNP